MNLLPVQSFQETLHSGLCGPASLKMVLSYWSINKTEAELAELCQSDSELGTSSANLQKAAMSFGLKTELKNFATLEDVGGWLDKKIPVIVNWFSRGRSDSPESEVADGHYSVVVGLDEEYIYLQDPEIGALRKIKRSDFLTVWFDFSGRQINNWDELIVRQLIAIFPN